MNICILGAGAFGLALASATIKNNNVIVWSKFSSEIDNLKKTKQFKNLKLNKNINYSINLEKSIKNVDLIIIAIPVFAIRETIKDLKKYYKNTPIIIASKGIEQDTNMFAYDIVKSIIKTNNIGVISGGTFATDMINNVPMGITLATKSTLINYCFYKAFKNANISLQSINDINGLEICGSIKNIIAIGSGIISGMNYPESTKYLFITKSIYEIKNLVMKLKGKKETILTYAGIDDIYMTCSSTSSRNYTLGYLIGSNNKEKDNYLKNNTVEGYYTSKSIYQVLEKNNLNDYKILISIYNILYNKENKQTLIDFLLK